LFKRLLFQKIPLEAAAVGVITNSSQSPYSLPLPKPPKVEFPTLYPSFFTATCKDWLPLLQDKKTTHRRLHRNSRTGKFYMPSKNEVRKACSLMYAD
jgi:hypothetical protein